MILCLSFLPLVVMKLAAVYLFDFQVTADFPFDFG